MRQRASPAVEDALQIIQHRQDDLILFAEMMQIKTTGHIAIQHVMQGGARHVIGSPQGSVSAGYYPRQ
ncbi:hypothetical protein D3C85_1379310 [compost metagenome]